jgi:cation transport ATPase
VKDERLGAERAGRDLAPLAPAWVILLVGVIVAVVVLLGAQIALFRFHFGSRPVIWVSVGLQQAVFALAAIYVHMRAMAARTREYALQLLILVTLSAFFALAVPTMVQAAAENLQSAQTDFTNLAYSTPTILIVIYSAIRWISTRTGIP